MNIETGYCPEEQRSPESAGRELIEDFVSKVREKREAPIGEIKVLAGNLQEALQPVAERLSKGRDVYFQYLVALAYLQILTIRPDYKEYCDDVIDGVRMSLEYDSDAPEALRQKTAQFLEAQPKGTSG